MRGDTTTLVDTLVTAAEQVEAVGAPGIAEVVADKGYHSNETMVGFAAIGVRSYVSEPDRGRRHWKGQAAARDAVYANRRRIRGARGKRLLRQRGELVERPNAHLYETGRMAPRPSARASQHPETAARPVCGVNLGLLMRHLTGVGTPRSLQGRASARLGALIGLLSGCWGRVRRFWASERHDRPIRRGMVRRHANTDTRFSIDNQPLLPRAARAGHGPQRADLTAEAPVQPASRTASAPVVRRLSSEKRARRCKSSLGPVEMLAFAQEYRVAAARAVDAAGPVNARGAPTSSPDHALRVCPTVSTPATVDSIVMT